jgi:ribosomal protein L11 methyltransferase
MPNSVLEPWWEIRVTLPDAQADDAGALLVDAGALGCEHRSTPLPAPVFGCPTAAPAPTDTPAGETTLVVSFDGHLLRDEVVALTLSTLAGLGIVLAPPAWQIIQRTDVDWAERWKAYFPPLRLGRHVFVVPSWERDFRVPPGGVAVTLDPGLAFGTGQHATTALCVEILEAGLDAEVAEAAALRLLDVGCGSGILAIAAAKLGCRRVLAIDNDPTAIVVTRENVATNSVGEQVQASDLDLAQIPEVFDWVMANILAPTLVALAEPLIAHTAPGGSLVLSGLLATQEDEVLAAIHEAAHSSGRGAPHLVQRAQRDEWLALHVRV